MTTAAPGTDLAIPDDDYLAGLDDFDINDAIIPRLQLDHKRAVFVDNMTGEQFSELDVIILGLVKQRVLWDPKVDDDNKPLCRSFDAKSGHKQVGFPDAAAATAVENPDGTLACETCPLQTWGSHPTRDIPWCAEQFVLAVLKKQGDHGYAPALLTFQRSAVKPTKAYLSGFKAAKEPAFICRTVIGLQANQRGQVDYAKPTFARSEPTDEEFHGEYASAFIGIRSFLHTPRAAADETETGPSSTSSTSSVTASTSPAVSTPTAAPSDDDEVPF